MKNLGRKVQLHFCLACANLKGILLAALGKKCWTSTSSILMALCKENIHIHQFYHHIIAIIVMDRNPFLSASVKFCWP